MKKINPLTIKRIINSLKKNKIKIKNAKKNSDKVLILKKVVEKETKDSKNIEEIIEYVLNNFENIIFPEKNKKK